MALWGAHKSIFFPLACPPRDLKLDGGRQSAGAVSLKEIIGLEGVELGADGKVRLPGSGHQVVLKAQGSGSKGRGQPTSLSRGGGLKVWGRFPGMGCQPARLP